MPVLVHLADEREAGGIRKNGIKMPKHAPGIFCMPVLPNFYVSYQWLREMKRTGVRTFVGVYFKLDSHFMVYAGKYNQPHQRISLGEAIREIMSMDDPLGYELIIDRKIQAAEIKKIRILPQKVGWRYFPSSHNSRPTCACRVCIPKGSIKGRRLRDKIEPPDPAATYAEILARLTAADSEDEIEELLRMIQKKRRRTDPSELLFLLERKSDIINQSVALALSTYRHKNTKSILMTLLASRDTFTRETAADSLLMLYGEKIEPVLIEMNDPAINEAIRAWKH